MVKDKLTNGTHHKPDWQKPPTVDIKPREPEPEWGSWMPNDKLPKHKGRCGKKRKA